MKKKSENKTTSSRRQFLKKSLMAGASVLATGGLVEAYLDTSAAESGEKVKVLTTDGNDHGS